jgi:DNA-binding response OmpR family regulator
MYRVVLELEGYDFECTDNVETALGLIVERDYDLFVLDSGLIQGGSGVDLCRRIRESDAPNPIIVATGKAYPHERLEAESSGADAYLIKPMEPRELVATVAGLLG